MIIVGGQYLDTLLKTIQKRLAIVETWSANIGLSVNSKKTKIKVFTKRYKLNKICNLILNTKELQLSSDTKYFGVKFDDKLPILVWRY